LTDFKQSNLLISLVFFILISGEDEFLIDGTMTYADVLRFVKLTAKEVRDTLEGFMETEREEEAGATLRKFTFDMITLIHGVLLSALIGG